MKIIQFIEMMKEKNNIFKDIKKMKIGIIYLLKDFGVYIYYGIKKQ